MPRISPVSREQLSDEDKQYHDAIVGTRGSVRGPFGVLLNSPKLAARVADTGAFVRFEFGQPEVLKETLIIATAKEMNQQYEFSAHARLARQAGVSDATIAAIANGTAPAGLEGDEALLVNYVHELLRQKKVSDGTFKAMADRFGEQDTLHFTVLCGHYLLVAQVLTAFDVEAGRGHEQGDTRLGALHADTLNIPAGPVVSGSAGMAYHEGKSAVQVEQMLTISVKNFGPIAEGSVDLKPLTIFVGPSNTGKSYMATAVYAFAKAARSVGNEAAFDGRTVTVVFRVTPYGMGNSNSDDTKAVVQELQNFADRRAINPDLLVSDLPESTTSWLKEETGERLRIVQQHTLDQLLLLHGEPSAFAKYGSQGNRTSLSVSRHTPQLNLEVGLPWTVNPTPEFDISTVSAPVQAIELLRRIPLNQESDLLPPGTKILLVDPIVLRVLDGVPSNSYYLPASRSGIIRVERPLTSSIIRQSSLPESQRLGLPVSLGVISEFLADFVGLSQENRLSDSNDDLDNAIKFLESEVLHGEIDLDESAGLPRPDVTYETEAGKFTLNQTSSMVTELAPVILFLKYLIRPGHLLILEEPESHLHPAAQRQLARGIVRL